MGRKQKINQKANSKWRCVQTTCGKYNSLDGKMKGPKGFQGGFVGFFILFFCFLQCFYGDYYDVQQIITVFSLWFWQIMNEITTQSTVLTDSNHNRNTDNLYSVLYIYLVPQLKLKSLLEIQVQLQFKQVFDNVSGGRVRAKEGSSLILPAKGKDEGV